MSLTIICLAGTILSGCKKEENDISSWMSNYYKNPIPDQVKEKLISIDKSEMLKKYPSASQPVQGFLTQFLVDNPSQLAEISNLLTDMIPTTKYAVAKSIWFSNLPQSTAVLDSLDIKFHGTPPNLDNFAEIQSFDSLYAGFLDFQWGRFFESGSRQPIEMIVHSLEFGENLGSIERYKQTGSEDERQNGIKEAAFKSAVWSLKSNALKHEKIQKHLVEILNDEAAKPEALGFLTMILKELNSQTADVPKDSSYFFSEIEYFSNICNTYRPDFIKMENYEDWVKRIKGNVKQLKNMKPRKAWMNLALGEFYRLGWNLSIDGYSTEAMEVLSDTNSTDRLFKCRQKMSLGKFLLNIDVRYNGEGVRILQDVKNDCVDSLPEAIWWISYGYLGQGNRDMAISYLQEYLTVVPNDSSAIHNLLMLQKEDVKIKRIKQ